jgi:type IV fimbrial biogenesis protein FimT
VLGGIVSTEPSRPSPARRQQRSAARGFTLVELIVVVIIISILAVIATPSITQQMRDRRVQQASQEVAAMYRTARMRAMGRGNAVLVRYTNATGAQGRLEVREGVRGGTLCAAMPETGCQRSWITLNPPTDDNRLLTAFDLNTLGVYADIRVEMDGASGAAVADMDVCYTPLGRTFVRYTNTPGSPFTQLAGVAGARVFRLPAGSSAPLGILRRVFILPNGTARTGT